MLQCTAVAPPVAPMELRSAPEEPVPVEHGASPVEKGSSGLCLASHPFPGLLFIILWCRVPILFWKQENSCVSNTASLYTVQLNNFLCVHSCDTLKDDYIDDDLHFVGEKSNSWKGMKEMALSLFFIPSSGASRAFSQLWSLDSALFALAAPDLQILDVKKYPLRALYLNEKYINWDFGNYLLTLRSLVKLRLMDVSPVCLNWRRSLLRMIKKSNEMQFSQLLRNKQPASEACCISWVRKWSKSFVVGELWAGREIEDEGGSVPLDGTFNSIESSHLMRIH